MHVFLQQAFNVFDSDGSGSIDAAELGSCLRALGQNLTDQELEDLILSVDEDRSGSIEFEVSYVIVRPCLGRITFDVSRAVLCPCPGYLVFSQVM